MDTEHKNKREILRDKVVALVKDFVKTEGDITIRDLIWVFGNDNPIAVDMVSNALSKEKITFIS